VIGDEVRLTVEWLREEAARTARGVVRAAARVPVSALVIGGARTARYVAGSWQREQRIPASSPLARPTAAVIAQVALDECVLAVMNNPSRVPDREQIRAVANEITEARALFARHGWLTDPTSYHLDPPVLDRPAVAEARWLGHRFEKVVFESGYEPHQREPGRDRWLSYEPNRMAYGWALRHKDGSRPWLVCVHGFGTGRPWMDFPAFRAARLHHDLGLNLLFPVLPLHGPRNIGGLPGGAFMSHDLMNVVHGMAQSVWDIRRLISWIREQAPSAVGVYGISLGSYVTSLLAGLERDLDCVVAGVPVCDLPSLYLHHSDERFRRRGGEVLTGTAASDVLSVVSPLAIEPRLPWDRRFVFAGLVDRMATPTQARRLWEHWERPRITWYDGNHVGFMWSRDVTDLLAGALEASGLSHHETPAA